METLPPNRPTTKHLGGQRDDGLNSVWRLEGGPGRAETSSGTGISEEAQKGRFGSSRKIATWIQELLLKLITGAEALLPATAATRKV